MTPKRRKLLPAAGRGQWLTIGLGVKRWLLVLALGSASVGVGLVYLILLLRRAGLMPGGFYRLLTVQFLPPWLRALLPLTLGAAILLVALLQLGRTIVAPFRRPDEDVSQSILTFQRRRRGPHLVAIGGGTGMPTLLRGLSRFTNNITAIVTVADDGGSSGRLRRELGVLPPGDFRNNLAALARDEGLMTQLLQYRFGRASRGPAARNGRGGDEAPADLAGHAFGNLLLAALAGITGSFEEGLLAAERVLAIRGRVLPSTVTHINLAADLVLDGGVAPRLVRVSGESAIPRQGGRIQRVYLEPAAPPAYPPALQAIFRADAIVLGPGSLYTSILPNLLVPGLASALAEALAPKIYVCNLAAQPGETDNYTVGDHYAAIEQHVSAAVVDVVLANDNLSIPATRGGGRTIYVPLSDLQSRAADRPRLVTADLVDDERPWRHDSEKLAQAILTLIDGGRGR